MSKIEELLKQQQEIAAAIQAEYAKSREAAEKGEALAQYALGIIYCKGQGVPQNFAEAGRCFKLAAAQGNLDAQIDLAGMYEQAQGVAKDAAEAVRLYQLAVAQGSAVAHGRLGRLFESGQGACMKTTMVWSKTMPRPCAGTNWLPIWAIRKP